MYSLLPFRFQPRNDGVLIVNFVGDYKILSINDFSRLLSGELKEDEPVFFDLQGMQIISSGDVDADLEILSTRYRSKKAFLDDFTTLHMVVTTLRCNQQCKYCHATARREDDPDRNFDMSAETALKTADMIMQSPSPCIKVEFQGGDSSLNLPIVKLIVDRVNELNRCLKKKGTIYLTSVLPHDGSLGVHRQSNMIAQFNGNRFFLSFRVNIRHRQGYTQHEIHDREETDRGSLPFHERMG